MESAGCRRESAELAEGDLRVGHGLLGECSEAAVGIQEDTIRRHEYGSVSAGGNYWQAAHSLKASRLPRLLVWQMRASAPVAVPRFASYDVASTSTDSRLSKFGLKPCLQAGDKCGRGGKSPL